MRFTSGMLVGAALGYAAARWARRDDPAIVTGPRKGATSQGPASRLDAGGRERLAQRAQAAGILALQRARGNIQARLVGEGDTGWN